ncbi:MAG: NUDIX hydrolase [Chitinophagaceae bacterium]|nr:NUDIX hydrolase [Chitinophagaceae bacterium]
MASDRHSMLSPSSPNVNFLKALVSVDCVIFGFADNELKVLLIKSDLEVFKDKWSLLGDLVRPSEDLESASYRVLNQRTGLTDVYLEQVSTFSAINRHPGGRVITTAFYSLVNIKDHQLKLSDHELHWHPIKEISDLAFDHDKILATCLDRLREKIQEYPIVFNLLPEKFSLRELQTLYESILNTKMDRRNFRKKFFLMNWLVDLDELETEVSHRPGRLYRFNDVHLRDIRTAEIISSEG